jgi:hypothetical protein
MPKPPEPVYVAPARFVLTVLHRKGDAPGQVTELAAAEPVDGWTACGRPMLSSGIWVAVEARDGDSLCEECMAPGRRPPEDVQEMLL